MTCGQETTQAGTRDRQKGFRKGYAWDEVGACQAGLPGALLGMGKKAGGGPSSGAVRPLVRQSPGHAPVRALSLALKWPAVTAERFLRPAGLRRVRGLGTSAPRGAFRRPEDRHLPYLAFPKAIMNSGQSLSASREASSAVPPPGAAAACGS